MTLVNLKCTKYIEVEIQYVYPLLSGELESRRQLTTIVPMPVNMSTPSAFIELVKLLRIFEARLFA